MTTPNTEAAAPPPEVYDEVAPFGAEERAHAERILDPAPEAAAQLPMDKIRRYKLLREMQATAEAEHDGFKEEADKLQAELVEDFTDAGVQNINVDGKTVYLHRSVYARRREGVEAEDVRAALRAAGVDELITETVNANTLSAWVRELTEDDDAPGLPAEVAEVLEPGERYSVRINAAGSRPKNKTRSK